MTVTPPIILTETVMKDDIERVEYVSMLYDFYGSLLNESRNEVMALYHEDNLSLSEIAEELGQSRQAVHYTLRKAEEELSAYEEKLGLIAAYGKNQKLAAEAAALIDRSELAPDAKEAIKHIVSQIIE